MRLPRSLRAPLAAVTFAVLCTAPPVWADPIETASIDAKMPTSRTLSEQIERRLGPNADGIFIFHTIERVVADDGSPTGDASIRVHRIEGRAEAAATLVRFLEGEPSSALSAEALQTGSATRVRRSWQLHRCFPRDQEALAQRFFERLQARHMAAKPEADERRS